jgi:hypothetical protein
MLADTTARIRSHPFSRGGAPAWIRDAGGDRLMPELIFAASVDAAS